MVGGLITLGSAAADTPGTTISVTPSSGLSDSQSVAVAGTGFTPQASLSIFECKGSPPTGCVLVGTASTDTNGDFNQSVTVTRNFTATQGALGATDCGPEDNCTVYAEDTGGKSDTQAISFASAATTTTSTTIAPTPTLVVNPDTNLGATQTVTVTGSGFTPGASVVLSECKLANGTPQSCAPIGSAFTDPNGGFTTQQTVTRTFTATQGAVQGSVNCLPEDTCVIDATDAGNAEDSAPISFATATPQITVVPDSNLGASQTVTVTGSGFAPSASVVIYECKLNGGGTQSCVVIGSVLSDANGNVPATEVTVTEDFTATQGVTGATSCLPENDCVVYAIDSVNNDDAAPISFAVIEPTTTTSSTTTSSTTSTTVLEPTTTTSTSTTVPVPPQSATCNALLSARSSFNATIDALSAQFPALAPLLNLARAAGNAAFDVALRLNGCTSNVFTPAGSASDARVMRSVLPTWVLNRIQNLQTNPAAVTATPSPSVSTYTVVPGDTLTRIARRLLGSATRVRDLIAANPSLAAHPNLIHPGQILVIPG
jgi:nucleoid-associated protein YgaU